jgi:hypothetical protein
MRQPSPKKRGRLARSTTWPAPTHRNPRVRAVPRAAPMDSERSLLPARATGSSSAPMEARRQWDAFPLPPVDVQPDVRLDLSKQRTWRRSRRAVVANEVLGSLTHPACGGSYASPAGSSPSALQLEALRQAISSVSAVGVLPCCTVREAVDAFLSSDISYFGGKVSSTVVSYEHSLVSLPIVGATALQLWQVLDPKGQDFLVNFSEHFC